jgi:hypothetical protein
MFRRLLDMLGGSSHEAPAAKATPGASARAGTATRQAGAGRPGKTEPDFHAVAIVTGSGCCDAARQLLGQRFLLPQAPRLPLADCSAPQGCKCRYRKFDDRRQDERRHPYGGGLGMNIPAGDHRKGRGRRSKDR